MTRASIAAVWKRIKDYVTGVDLIQETTEVKRPAAHPRAGSDDLKKVHAEVLQIVNQRFTLTGSAVVFFGAVAGWVSGAVLKDANGGSWALDLLPMVATVLVGLVLYLLFRYQASLAVTLRWLTTYLMACGSDWEWHWHRFRRQLLKPAPASKLRQLTIEAPFFAYSRSTGVLIRLMMVSYAYFLALRLVVWSQVAHPNLRTEIVSLTSAAWATLGLLTAATCVHMQRVVVRCENVSESEMMDVWFETCPVEPKPRTRPARRQPSRAITYETPVGIAGPYPRGDL